MKKIILLLSFVLLLNSACEKDDFCLQNPITPSLVIRFYDETNRNTIKSVSRLSLIAESKTDSLFTNISTDSIAIPLNSLDSKTVYILKMNNIDGNFANNKIAKLTIEYDPIEEFVSRSCGFKITFNNVNFSSDNSWILDFDPTTLTTIDNQNAAHIQIYH